MPATVERRRQPSSRMTRGRRRSRLATCCARRAVLPTGRSESAAGRWESAHEVIATSVVKVDEAGARIHAIGGNVRGVVSLKQIPAVRDSGRPLRPANGNSGRPMFAHLKLRASSIDANALDTSPTIAARSRRDGIPTAPPPRKPVAQIGSCFCASREARSLSLRHSVHGVSTL